MLRLAHWFEDIFKTDLGAEALWGNENVQKEQVEWKENRPSLVPNFTVNTKRKGFWRKEEEKVK